MSPATLLVAPIEDRLTMLELSREQNVSPPTPWRWAIRGVRGVKLPTIMLGHKRITTRGAFVWWVEQLTALAAGEPQVVPDREAQRNEAAIEVAEDEATRLLKL